MQELRQLRVLRRREEYMILKRKSYSLEKKYMFWEEEQK